MQSRSRCCIRGCDHAGVPVHCLGPCTWASLPIHPTLDSSRDVFLETSKYLGGGLPAGWVLLCDGPAVLAMSSHWSQGVLH